MHHLGRLVAALVVVLAGGCVKLDSYSCLQSSECQNGDVLGSCEPGGLCSFPDPMCTSGKKYGELAGALSGLCVGEGGTGSSTDPSTSTPTTSTTLTTADTSTSLDLTSTSLDLTSTTATSEVTVTTSTGTTTTTGDDTTAGPTCGQIGEACVDGACCGACATCNVDGTCVPLGAEEGAAVCGTCSFCGGDGECAASAEGSECFDDCSAYVWEMQAAGLRTACFGYAAKKVASVCDGAGGCAPIDAVAECPDPALKPDTAIKLAECDTACLEGIEFCAAGAPTSELTMDSFCRLRSEGDNCHSSCSVDGSELAVQMCLDGVCTELETVSCGAYVCDDALHVCPDACATDEQCLATVCIDMQCQ